MLVLPLWRWHQRIGVTINQFPLIAPVFIIFVLVAGRLKRQTKGWLLHNVKVMNKAS